VIAARIDAPQREVQRHGDVEQRPVEHGRVADVREARCDLDQHAHLRGRLGIPDPAGVLREARQLTPQPILTATSAESKPTDRGPRSSPEFGIMNRRSGRNERHRRALWCPPTRGAFWPALCEAPDQHPGTRARGRARELVTPNEATRAFEQYDEVDPRNRHVASDLEARWNSKLEQVEKLKTSLGELDSEVRLLSVEERGAILALGERFEQVWHSDRCPIELKKKILLTVVEEVIVDLDDETQLLSFVIHWKGGTHTRFEMLRPRGGVGQKTADDDLEIIRKMAVRYGDPQIANVLNRLGRRTGKGKRWNQSRVASARKAHSIAGRSTNLRDPDVLNMNEAARHCRVSDTTIRRPVEAGLLPMRQVVPWARWEIRRCDLESASVRAVVAQLHATGRLVLEGHRSAEQPELPFENQGGGNARYRS
jgi:hypothetical protein